MALITSVVVVVDAVAQTCNTHNITLRQRPQSQEIPRHHPILIITTILTTINATVSAAELIQRCMEIHQALFLIRSL